MKKYLSLLFSLFSFIICTRAQTSYTWTGGSSSFTTSTNWSPTGTPGAADDVVFDGTSNANCNFDAASIAVKNIIITSAYTGTINALATNPTINSNFTQAGGTFISTSSNIDVLGNISFTGGTFLHNSGDVTIYVGIGSTWSITGSPAFNNLNISTTAGNSGTERIINLGSCTTNNLILAGAGNKYSYQGSITILTDLTVSGSNTGIPTVNTGTFTFSGAGPVSITGASAAGRNLLPNIVFNTSGSISMTGHVNVQGDWTGTQGTLTVGNSTENFYGTAAISGTAAAFDNITVQSGATVNMPSNAEVKVGGALTNSGGTLNFQTTTALGLNGSSSQSIGGSGFTLAGIKAYDSGSARNVTIGTAINILDSLKVGANVTLASGGNITLKSSAALKARVAEIGANSSITGNVTVETFIPGGTTGWANMGTPGVAGQTAKSWDTYYATSGANGIPMTCGGCDYDQTALGSWFESIQGWNESISYYDTNIVSTTPLSPGTGFWVYVGDGPASTNDLKLINTGVLVQGPQNILLSSTSGTAQGLNLVANPFACPISWTKVLANDPNNSSVVNDVIYVWNADAGVSGQTTSYVSATNLSSHSGTTGITDVIPAGQGFYVEYTGFLIPTLAIYESMKTFSVTGNTSANPLLRAESNGIQSFRLKVSGNSDWDETAFCSHSNGTKFYDKGLDAKKFFQSPGYLGYPGPYTNYTSISSKDALNEDYSINTFGPLSTNLNIPVLVKVSTSGTYTISAKDFQNFNTCVGLIDKLDNSYHDLRSNPYVCTINDTTSSPRFELVLCRDPYVDLVSVPEVENSGSILINQDQQGAYVKTVFTQGTKAVISAYNILGQKLMNDLTVEGTVTNTRLNLDVHNQIVIIKVATDKETSTKKLVVH